MSQKDKTESKLPITMVVGIAASLVVLVLTQAPLKSSRPLYDSPRDQHTESVPAWLWQDPLQAAQLDQKESRSKRDSDLEMQLRHQMAQSTLTFTTTKDHSAGNDQVFKLAKEFLDVHKQIRPTTNEKVEQTNGTVADNGKKKNPDIEVLLVMIDGASHGSAHERRLRSRYAAISALGVACYVPTEQSAIRYITWHNTWRDKSQDSLIPYEWYEPSQMRTCSNTQPPILVMWLNETILENPVARLRILRENLQDAITKQCRRDKQASCPSTRYTIVGPQSSDSLRDILQQSNPQDLPKTGPDPFRLYSPNATIPFHLLAKSLHGRNGTIFRCTTEDDCRKEITDRLMDLQLDLVYSIDSDRTLMTALVEELERRDVKVGQDRIALLAEWDTLYGRSLPLEFKAVACVHASRKSYFPVELSEAQRTTAKDARTKYCSTVERAEEAQIHLYSEFLETRLNLPRTSYLAGLDGLAFTSSGRTSSNGNSKASQQSQGNGHDKSITLNVDYLERPEGESQLDYVRRIATQLRETAEDKPYRAILVLGTDVYDQLLILQALRQEFPQTVFLATDLDARFWHADQLKWTRNLVIASHFGLELDQDLQRDIPPFRDSYQTSLFFAVLQASGFIEKTHIGANSSGFKARIMSAPQRPFSSNIPVRIYEIGRHGPVDLSIDCPTSSDCTPAKPIPDTVHPDRDTPKEHLEAIAWRISLASILILMPLFGWKLATQKNARWKTFISGTITFLLCWAIGGLVFHYILSEGDGGEPFSVTDGISIWPSIFIKFFAILLGIRLLVRVRGVVRSAIKTLKEQCLPSRKTSTGFSLNLPDDLRKEISHLLGQFEFFTFLRKAWLFWTLLLLAIALMPLLISLVFFPDQQALLFVRPSRGTVVEKADLIVSLSTVLLILPLLNIYLLSISWGFRCIAELLKPTLTIPDSTELTNENILTWSQNNRVTVHLIAKVSEAFYWLPFYPMLILILLIIGRSHVIDAWTISPPIYLTWMAHGILIACGAWMIRSTSEHIHAHAIENLKNLEWRLSQTQLRLTNSANIQVPIKAPKNLRNYNELLAHVTHTMNDIAALRKGGLIGILEQPVVSTSLLVILALLQHFILIF